MRTLKALQVFVASLVVVCLFNGCGGSGGGGTSGPASGTVTGYAYQTSTGTIVVTNSATPPSGDTPVSGGNVSDGIVSATSGADGSFHLGGVQPGLDTLHITKGVSKLDIPLTVIGNATIQVGPPPVTRIASYSSIVSSLTALHLDPNTTMAIGPEQPRPAGTVVTDALGDDNGNPSSTITYTLPTSSWLIYVDPKVTVRMQHSMYYYFVDASTGAITVVNATSWPLINGLNYYGNRDSNLTYPDLFLAPAIATPAVRHGVMIAKALAAASKLEARGIRPLDGTGITYSLIVQGADESDENADSKNITKVFGHGGIAPAQVSFSKPGETSSTASTSARVTDVVDKFKSIIAKAKPEDTIFIYMTGHGTRGGGVKLDTDALTKCGTPVDFETLTASSFNWANCQACRVIIIIDACYAAKMGSQFATALQKKGCINYTIMTASDSSHQSVGVPSYDLRRSTGGFFTNAFLSAFSSQVSANPSGSVDLPKSYQDAKAECNGSLLYGDANIQNPQLFVGNAAAGCPCGPPLPVCLGPAQTWCNSANNTVYVAGTLTSDLGIVTATTGGMAVPHGIRLSPSVSYTWSLSSTIQVGNAPYGVVGNNGNKIFTANSDATVSVVDLAQAKVVATVPIGHGTKGMIAYDGSNGHVYVTNSTDGTVTVIDAVANTVTKTINVGPNPVGIQANSSLNRIYVASSDGKGGGEVTVLDGSTDTAITTIPLPGTLAGLDVNYLTGRVYVVCNQTVAVIDGSKDTVIAASTINAGTQPKYLACSSNLNKVFVADYTGNKVSIMDTTTNNLITTVPTGNNPTGLGLFPVTDIVYAPNYTDGSITFIDGDTNGVTSTLKLGP